MDRPVRLLVVARWYPAVDDPVRGSFVADQVAALAEAGAVDPVVASFEFARLNRHAERQKPERDAIRRRYASALETRDDVVVAGGWARVPGTWPSLGGVPVARLPVATGPDDPPWLEDDDHAAALLPFARGYAARTGTVDLIHAHAGFPDGSAARVIAAAYARPYVVTEHASRVAELLADPEVRRRYVLALEGAARVVTVSESLAAELRRWVPALADTPGRLVVIPNAVPMDRFWPGDRAGRRARELLYVGTRKPEKGIETLLRAFGAVHAGLPDATLRLVGRSPTDEDEDRWRTMAGELGVAGSVSFEDATDRAGVAEAMRRADLFVHPSRRETFGVVAVEALASGLPVVATRSGGVDEILGPEPSSLGALVPVDDHEALAAAIVDVLGRRERFDARALRAAVENRFAAGAVAAQVLGLYDEVLAEAPGGGTGPGGGAGPRGGTGPGGGTGPSGGAGPSDAGPSGGAGPSGAGPSGGTPRGAPAAPVVVAGLNRVRAARLLAPLPAGLLAELTLVTTVDLGDQPLPDGVGRVVELDLNAGYTAALEDARRPRPQPIVRTLARRLRWTASGREGTPLPDPEVPARVNAVKARHAEYRQETAAEGIASALVSAPRPGLPDDRPDQGREAGPMPDLVCLDGYDLVAAEPALDRRLASLAPGSIRWLADRWAAAHVSATQPAGTASPVGQPAAPAPPAGDAYRA